MKVYRRVVELNLLPSHHADLNEIAGRNTTREKPALGEVIAKTDSVHPEPASLENGALLADGGFQPQEKIPARRPRKKKKVTSVNDADENGVVTGARTEMVTAPRQDELPLPEPAPAKKPRRRKVIVVDAVSVNGKMTNTIEENVVAPKANLRAAVVAAAELVLPAESE